MKRFGSKASSCITTGLGLLAATALSLLLTACGGGGGNSTPPPPSTYTVTVNSTNPASGVTISYGNSVTSLLATGSTSFGVSLNSGTTEIFSAPATASNGNTFSSWTGCTSVSGNDCTVTVAANTTITANYTTPSPTTYVLTVDSVNPASGVAITVSPNDNSGQGNGSTVFTRTYNAGSTVTLTAPSTSGSNTFSSWEGCTSFTSTTCTVTLNADTTVTAKYTVPTAGAPTVTVTPSASSITTAQALSVTIAVAGGSGQPTPTGSVTLSGGGYTSAATSLSSGGATINIPAGTFTATGSVTLTASYTPDSGSSSIYTTATGSNSVTITAVTYTLTVDSTDPSSGVAITVTPPDNNDDGSGGTSFTRTYNSGAVVTLTAPTTSGSATFSSWTGCTIVAANICTETLTANTTITANYTTPTYTLTIDSVLPTSGVSITASPADNNGHTSGSTPFTLTYNSGTAVTLTAPATEGSNTFSSWSGCTTTNSVTCNVTVSANATVTANYVVPVAVTPNPATVTIGTPLQFSATVDGQTSTAVTWSVTSSSGSPGTISTSGVYTAPYPAPATVTVKATSTADTTKSASVTVTLSPPTASAGPVLTIDASPNDGDSANPNCPSGAPCPISPLIYGMNAYLLDATTAANANITVARWGGDDTSRYNYQNGIVNSANDYYFENFSGSSSMLGGTGQFSDFIAAANTLGIKTIGTAPVLGYVSNSTVNACSFPKSTYPGQQSYNGANCGNGVYPQGTNGCTSSGGCSFSGNSTTWQTTSLQEPPPTAPVPASGATKSWADTTWTGSWVNCLLTTGTNCTNAAGKDATIWDLDNEPAWWDAVHRDVHPNPSTYDEVTNGGIGTALAIKTEDPNALTGGPVIDYWWNYFYSKKDIESGWSSGNPCYQPWSNPTDRTAHGGLPMIVYYIQQMAAASTTYNMRLLDYVTIHSYSAATYNGSSVGLTTAGNTAEQEARMNSTRALWDPTYTDPNFPQPNYSTNPSAQSCTVPLQAPEIIPMMQSWITSGWTGTTYPAPGTSIDEYNFGGNESINGAVTQADVLGIFGKYGLTMATLWPTTNYTQQVPGNMAFEIYRNYDGNKSTFGDEELNSSSVNQGQLSVYAAHRTADNTLTVVVINKTYGDLSSTLTLDNLTGVTTAHAFLYSNANLNAIVAQPDVTVTPGTTNSTLTTTFPAQSITLLIIPE